MKSQEKAGIKIAIHRQLTERKGYWLVQSSNQYLFYRVDFEQGKCECDEFRNLNSGWCRHLYAVKWHLHNRSRLIKKSPRPPVNSVPRDWRSYHAGRSAKHRLFKEFLNNVCQKLPDFIPSKKGGRPRVPLKDLVYASVLKVRNQKAGKAMESMLEEEDEAGRLPGYAVPKANTLFNFFNSWRAFDVLNMLIGETSAPFIHLEHAFAIDSTHFPISRKEKGYNFKTDKVFEKSKTFKAHVCTGVLTGVVASLRVTPDEGTGSADAAKFPHLLRETIQRFSVLEILADAAYCSRRNFRCCDEVGVKLFTKFGKRDTNADDSSYGRALLFSKEHPKEQYLKFRNRSSIEATFSVWKRRFPNRMFFKNEQSIANEIMCIALVHNLELLVRARFELGMKIELK